MMYMNIAELIKVVVGRRLVTTRARSACITISENIKLIPLALNGVSSQCSFGRFTGGAECSHLRKT